MESLDQQFTKIFSNPWLALILFAWLTFWKGFALWRAAGKRHLVWFVILLLVNTMGLLEIAYIFSLNKWDIDGGRLLTFIERKFSKGKDKKTKK